MYKIDTYSFGKITIDGIIYPGRINSSWWREEGHRLRIEDLAKVIEEKPDVLVIGTGFYGYMKVEQSVIEELSKRNIEVHIEKTGKATELYNQINEDKKAIAAFHLTC